MPSRAKRKNKAVLIIFLLLAVIVVAAVYAAPDIYKTYFYPQKYSEYVDEYSEKYGFDKMMVYAVIKTESGFKPDAESNVGARGLMQLMNDTFEWVKYRMADSRDVTYDDMYNPEYNIEYGTCMLSILYNEYGDYPTALAAYHAGRGTVNSWLKDSENSSDGKTLDKQIPSIATSHYVNKVMKSYRIYSDLYNDKRNGD